MGSFLSSFLPLPISFPSLLQPPRQQPSPSLPNSVFYFPRPGQEPSPPTKAPRSLTQQFLSLSHSHARARHRSRSSSPRLDRCQAFRRAVRDSPIFSLILMSSLCVDLDFNMQPSPTAMALPPPLRRGPHPLVDYRPIRGQRIRSLQDCAPGAVVALMRAHPRHLLHILVMRMRLRTACLSLIPPPLLLDLMANPGIYPQRQVIFPTELNLPGACCKRRPPSDLQAPLRLGYLVTP